MTSGARGLDHLCTISVERSAMLPLTLFGAGARASHRGRWVNPDPRLYGGRAGERGVVAREPQAKTTAWRGLAGQWCKFCH